jgi:hypothetical protein
MSDPLQGRAAAEALLEDPGLAQADLARIASEFPDLANKVAAHPSLYPGLRNWLAGLGRADVDAALAHNPAALPSLPPPPPSSTAGTAVQHPKAVAVPVLGILGVLGLWPLAVLAWILGSKAAKEVNRRPGTYSGVGAIRAGYILGIVGTVLGAIGWTVAVILLGLAGNAVDRAESQREQSAATVWNDCVIDLPGSIGSSFPEKDGLIVLPLSCFEGSVEAVFNGGYEPFITMDGPESTLVFLIETEEAENNGMERWDLKMEVGLTMCTFKITADGRIVSVRVSGTTATYVSYPADGVPYIGSDDEW